MIRIDRPHRRNAFDGATARAMEAAIDAYEADDSLRCAILVGSPEAFSSGQDLIAAAYGEMGVAPTRGGFGIMAEPPTKPIIAAVEGHALDEIFPLGRMGTPDDIAPVVAFFASDDSSWVTGTNFYPDGGLTHDGTAGISGFDRDQLMQYAAIVK